MSPRVSPAKRTRQVPTAERAGPASPAERARLVVVSNRVASMKDPARAGGLAVALLDTLRRSGGVWFGWSGEISERERRTPKLQHHSALTVATLDLTPDDYEDYYNGFANSTLWPLFHYRLDLATFDREHYQGYVRVNQRFAHTLLALLKAGDHIWIHDYHLMACGEERRRMGCGYPENRGRVSYIQIAPRSRDDVQDYIDIRRELESLSGSINSEYSEFDWTPLRYINRSFSRRALAGLFRIARIGLVTPLRDGMNLVAKEYVAAQSPRSPGVLVLSRFAGAARQAEGAIIVNPYDVQGVADALQRALNMPLAERKERWRTLVKGVRRDDVTAWRESFLERLYAIR